MDKIIDNKIFQEFVSIVIPSRNFDSLLKKCVSEIRKLYNDVEIIIVLDEIDYKNDFNNNITILKSLNTNISSKRNLGVKHSNKKYIAFIDSDAYPKRGWLEEAIMFMEQNETYSAVTGTQYNAHDDTFEQKCLRILHYSKLICHKEWIEIIDKNTKIHDCKIFSSANVILKKNIYMKLNGMDETIYLAEDNEFSNRFSKKNYKIKFIPNVAIYHREGKLCSFLSKGYAMSYYYSNMLIKGKKIKSTKETIEQLLPLIGVLIFFLLFIIFYVNNINYYILSVFPVIIFMILIKESFNLSLKLEEKKIMGFIFIFMSFCLFSFVWLMGTILGLICFPSNVTKYYKH